MTDFILKSNFFIFTGGPGSGKTTTLTALEKQNYIVVPEVARPIIKHQQAIGGNACHTGDRDAFLNLMLKSSIRDYQRMQHEKNAVFFDRGIPDLFGYAEAFCKKESWEVKEAVAYYRYNVTVFIFPPWEKIYINDKERQQDFIESQQTYIALKEGYLHCDYELVEVPENSVGKRVEFILSVLSTT